MCIYIYINIILIHGSSLTVVTTKIPHQNNQGQPVNPIGSSSCAASCPSRGSTPISSGKPIGAPPAWKWNKSSLWCRYIYIYVWVFPKIGVAPQIIHFNRVFHYKLSILGGFPPYFWKHPYIAKLKYFSNLDLPEIRGPISLPKRYLLGAQVVWGPGFKFQPSKRRSLPLQSKQGSSRGSKYRNWDIPSLKLTVCPSLPLKIGRNLKGKDRLPAFPAIQF